MTKYPVILADPPWKFRYYGNDKSGRHTYNKYPVMELDHICRLEPPADENCALFIWACWPMLTDALQVITAWGFKYKTLAWDWVKATETGMSFHFGMGYYTRANTEPCLLAIRGKMPVAVHDVQALIYSPVREHSRKPDEQYGKIERLYPDGPYLEMFARRPRPGWHVWGNEVVSDVEITA